MRRLAITANARRDIARILGESEDRHGPRAANRYGALIDRALQDLRRAPENVASKAAAGDLRLYRLRSAARRLSGAQTVRSPPHLVVYRFDDEQVDILRLLHGAMDLPRRLVGEPPRQL